jgi:anti-anti-sigma factor
VGDLPPISYSLNGHGAATIRIAGELDLAAGDLVLEAVAVALVATTRPTGGEAEVQLDLSGVSFIDCAGLSALLRAQRSAAARGCTLHVGGMSAAVRRLLELSGTTPVLARGRLGDPA